MALQSDWAALAMRDDGAEWLTTVADTRPDAPFIKLRVGDPLATWLASQQSILRRDDPELARLRGKMTDTDRSVFESAGAYLVAPMTRDLELVGLLAVGHGAAGTHYPVSHLNFLRAAADLATVAIGQAGPGEPRLDVVHPPADSDQAELVAKMAHDLKSPLTSMMVFADLLRANKRGNLVAGQVEQLGKIKRDGRRVTLLIDDFLDFSKISAGTLDILPTDFEASELFAILKDRFEPVLDIRSQSLRLSPPNRAVTLRADKDRVVQVISTLISNAARFSPESTPVDVEGWVERDRLYIRVSDSGHGMTEAQVTRVFTPFAEIEGSGAPAGSGLSLVIAKGLVDLHGGDLGIESQEGVGTKAQFFIPSVIVASSSQDIAA